MEKIVNTSYKKVWCAEVGCNRYCTHVTVMEIKGMKIQLLLCAAHA